jgi:hypothetical protein
MSLCETRRKKHTGRAMTDALTAENKIYLNAKFSRADHSLFCGERAAYGLDSAKQAWGLTLEFLRS